MSEESVGLLVGISWSQADTKSVFRVAVSPSPVDVPEEKVVGQRGKESHVGGPEGSYEVSGVGETEAGMEADVEDEDENVDVVGGIDEVGISGYESKSLTLLEILRPKRLAKRMCPRVSLTPLTFHNVSVQIFNLYL